jgi:hypothetical protein
MIIINILYFTMNGSSKSLLFNARILSYGIEKSYLGIPFLLFGCAREFNHLLVMKRRGGKEFI